MVLMISTVQAVARKSKSRFACVFCRWLSPLFGRRTTTAFAPVVQKEPVAYAARLIELPSGPALIWPYYNVRPGHGPFEIAIDSNSYRNPSWITKLPAHFSRGRFVVNLLPALTEEWLANEQFRINPEERIRDIILRYEERGVCFRKHYAVDLATTLRRDSEAWRYNWTLLFFYVAIFKKLLERRDTDEAMRELIKLSTADVPRAGMMLSLGALSLFLKSRQDLRLAGDKKPAYSFVRKFFDFQSGRKGESDHLTVGYLRNRALDLGMYYFFPASTSVGFKPLGEMVILTDDVPLRRLFFRILPFYFDPALSPAIPTSLAPAEFSSEDGAAFVAWRFRLNERFEPPVDAKQKFDRLANLAEFARSLCDSAVEKDALEEVWREWTVPHMVSIQPD